MLILSSIITKEWFKALISSIIILFILITVGEVVNGFLRNASARQVMLEYILKLPELMGKALPISALVSTIFSINKLKTHSELMAILASGYSSKKFYSLIGLCSLSIGLMQFVNLGFIQPYANKIKRQEFEKSQRNESRYIARSKIGSSDLLWYKSDEYFTSFSAFDYKNKILKNVTLYYFNNLNNLSKIIKAPSAKFIENSWNFENALVISNLNTKSFPDVKTKAIENLKIKEAPNDFDQFESDITTLTFFTLFKFIQRLDQTGISTYEYKVMLLDKLSLSIICIIFALLPAAEIFNPNRRSSSFGKNLIFTLIFSVLFWVFYSALLTQGISGNISPIPATMSIPILTSIYVFWVFLRNRKL